jgi:Lipase maturation factor
MAAIFLDTSALLRRYDRSEPGASRVRAICAPARGHTLLLARVASVEVASALTRKSRAGALNVAPPPVRRRGLLDSGREFGIFPPPRGAARPRMDQLATTLGAWSQAPDAWRSRWLLERALGAIYLIGFLVAAHQWPALLGERGLLPVPGFLARVSFRQAPSLFHLRYSDRLLVTLAWLGVALAAAVVIGAPQAGPAWLAMLAWFGLWALYLSIVNIGQIFYSFGWESLLLEAGFLAIFLGADSAAPPRPIIWLYRWLLFRVEFGAGLIKLRGDPCWRDFTCLYYHHETQPLPNPLSWYFHHLPKPIHRLEVLGNHVGQLVVPFGLFGPQPVAGLAGLAIVVHQTWLLLSGNFSWLNVLTVTLAVAAFDDAELGALLPVAPAALAPPAGWYLALVLGASLLVVVLSYWPARNLLSRHQVMNASFDPFHLVNTYGAFGSITRERYEIVLEGTDETEPTASTAWRAYEFKAKPGDPRRRPPQIAPYHLRLDWLMWFAAMSTPRAHPWLLALVVKLLEGDRATLRLLGCNPFPEAPPAFVRAELYHYRFSSRRERRASGAWWVRTYVGSYLPPLRLAA